MTNFIKVHNVHNKSVYINVDEISHFLEYHRDPNVENNEVQTHTCIYFKHSDRLVVVETVDELLQMLKSTVDINILKL